MKCTIERFVCGIPILFLLACPVAPVPASAQAPAALPGTRLLEAGGGDGNDFSARMVAGIDRFLMRATDESTAGRAAFWARDFSSPEAYEKSIAPNRRRLRTIAGAVDPRVSPVRMDFVAGPGRPAVMAESGGFRVYAIRWTVFEGVDGEGLLLQPKIQPPVARVVAIPDADQTPEMIAGLTAGVAVPAQFARRLAEAGCQVIVPALINRQSTWSGNPGIAMTDETHREWVWRSAFEMGRHVIGYEVQKVEAAVDWFESRDGGEGESNPPVGVAGYGEGGLIALYAAALDPRIAAALVSGYFDSRRRLWSEPIYRNIFGLLREFGDAEIAGLIAPHALIVEHSEGPRVDGPPEAGEKRRKSAAPGSLKPPRFDSVAGEVERARKLCPPPGVESVGFIKLIAGGDGATTTGPGSDAALRELLSKLGVESALFDHAGDLPRDIADSIDVDARQKRQVEQLVAHSRRLLRRSENTRAELWRDAVSKTGKAWPDARGKYRDILWNDVFGRLPDPSPPTNARSRVLEEHKKWTTWEIMLDVWPDVFAWGYLLVPGDIKPGERRPVVVCQHGLEGLPGKVIDEDRGTRSWRAYRAYGNQLAARGFVVYCPHNPYRGETAFRQLQRKANPLGLTLFSFILGQHQRQIEWLASLPFVDRERVGFYGISYGGVSALRLPALLDGYAISICSAAFNDWPRKVTSTDFLASYMFTREYDHFSFNLGNTFGNAELAALIAPRPFMVERGHNDGVAPDEWVAWEYAKVRRLYAKLGIPERTKIEFFAGGHEIHGQGTFDFLHRHLNWPRR